MADDEIRLTASMNDELSSALERIEKRLNDVERKMLEVEAASKATGDGLDDLGKKTDETSEKVKQLGDETEKTTKKSKDSTSTLEGLARGFEKAGKKAGNFGAILQAYKFAGMATGAFALAGGISAIGAGAVMAIGGLASLTPALAGILPLFGAVKLSMLMFKLAADQLSGPMTRMKQQFLDLGQEIADGGLASGLDYLATSMRGLSRATGKGLAGMGAEIGQVARSTGDWISSAPFLAQVNDIFRQMAPIVGFLSRGVLALGQAFVNVVQAAMPVAQGMAALFEWIAIGLRNWTDAQMANGNMQRSMLAAWNALLRVGGVITDVFVGLFRIFRIGAGYAGELGTGIEDLAFKFRQWTGSAEGVARINQYFQDSLPALREMGALLGMVAGGLVGLAGNQNVAPLLQQIREELAPAIGTLVGNLAGQGGLGPALIDVATALATLFSNLDFSALTMFAQAIADVLNGVIWLTQNVPGASGVVSGLLFAFLGFKMLGPVFSGIAAGFSAFDWMSKALSDTKELSTAQRVFAWGFGKLGSVFSTVGKGIIFVIRAIGIAMMSNPIIAAIMIIIGVLLLLWFKCDWFRNAVIAIWQWIADAAVKAWDWIKNAWQTTIDAVVAAAKWLWENGIKPVWDAIVVGAKFIWGAIVWYVKTYIAIISAIVMFLWTNVIKPVWDAIVAGAEFAWGLIKFAFQVGVYIIAAIIWTIAKSAEIVWSAIVAGAQWLWTNGIKPVWDAMVTGWNWLTGLISAAWGAIVAYLSERWNWIYANVIAPVIQWIIDKWNYWTLVARVSMQILSDFISGIWNWILGVINGVIQWITDRWNYWTLVAQVSMQIMGDFLSGIWEWIKNVFAGAVDWISARWSDFTTWLQDTFRPVGDFLSSIWTGISDGASRAADIVKGAWNLVVGAIKGAWNAIAGGWNSMPTITVPDWVPGMGGHSFSLPKLPTLWHGGETPGGPALVGEFGPEPLVRNGRVDWVGLNGPEIMNLPAGGYVVPNLNTLAAMPGLAKSIPSSVASAVARAVPAYSGASRGDGGLAGAVAELASAVRDQRPPISVGSESSEAAVLAALRQHDREREARSLYGYTAGRG